MRVAAEAQLFLSRLDALERSEAIDLSFLAEKVRPGAYLAWKGRLLEVISGELGTHDGHALCRDAAPADTLVTRQRTILTARGWLKARLVKPAPTPPAVAPAR